MKNMVHLIGFLGDDPSVTKYENGKSRASFRVATTERMRNANGEAFEDTQWHSIVVWGGTADVAEKYLKKGKEVGILGRLVHKTYDDKEGNKKYVTEISVNSLELLGKKSD